MRPYLILAFSLILVALYVSSPHVIAQTVEAQTSEAEVNAKVEEIMAASCERTRQFVAAWSDSPSGIYSAPFPSGLYTLFP